MMSLLGLFLQLIACSELNQLDMEQCVVDTVEQIDILLDSID